MRSVDKDCYLDLLMMLQLKNYLYRKGIVKRLTSVNIAAMKSYRSRQYLRWYINHIKNEVFTRFRDYLVRTTEITTTEI